VTEWTDIRKKVVPESLSSTAQSSLYNIPSRGRGRFAIGSSNNCCTRTARIHKIFNNSIWFNHTRSLGHENTRGTLLAVCFRLLGTFDPAGGLGRWTGKTGGLHHLKPPMDRHGAVTTVIVLFGRRVVRAGSSQNATEHNLIVTAVEGNGNKLTDPERGSNSKRH
jgi:hypothetical protein